MKTLASSLISELCDIGKQKTDSQGRIEYDFGKALSNAYFDALLGTTNYSAEELIQLHFRKAKNERLRKVKDQPPTDK